jgi:trehalose 6-phosphate synthase
MIAHYSNKPVRKPEPQRRQDQLVIVSNRAPLEHEAGPDGGLRARETGGGLATALLPVAMTTPLTWIAAPASEADRELARRGRPVPLGNLSRLRYAHVPRRALDLSYGTFANPILWFLQHSLWDLLSGERREGETERAWEEGYLPANQAMAEAVISELARGDGTGRVVLQDYHLYLAPMFIRNRFPRTALQQFVHIPWPGPEAWQRLPAPIVESICESLLANDSVVFQTEQSAQNFLTTVGAYLSGEVRVDPLAGDIMLRGHQTRVWANAISVDIDELRKTARSPEVARYVEALTPHFGEKTIVRVDRLDPSKNVLGGLQAYDILLQRHPEWAGRVSYLAFLVPTRTGVPEYQRYAAETLALAEVINARHRRPGWTPLRVFHGHNRTRALAALTAYDVLLVNSWADGMNLVAKEGPTINRRDGVLVLSTEAGAFEELRTGAVAAPPWDVSRTAQALHVALSMPEGERSERARRLRQAIFRHQLGDWLDLLLKDLAIARDTQRILAGLPVSAA